MEAIFHRFSSILQAGAGSGFRFLATGGSALILFNRSSFVSLEYPVPEGHSVRGFYSMHLNALYDLQKYTYPAAPTQFAHYKDEFWVFYDMVDRLHTPPGIRDVFIDDRGYCSYNKMAHVMERGQHGIINIGLHFFLKDVRSMLPPVMNHSIAYA